MMAAAPIQQNGTHTGVPIDLDPPDSRKRPLEAPPEAGSTKRTNTGGGYRFRLPPRPRRPPAPWPLPPAVPRPLPCTCPGPVSSRWRPGVLSRPARPSRCWPRRQGPLPGPPPARGDGRLKMRAAFNSLIK